MKKLFLLSILIASNLCAELSYEDFEKHIRQQEFENYCFMKVSPHDNYFFYKGKRQAYQEMIDYLVQENTPEIQSD